MLEFWNKKADDVMGQPLFIGVPEATGQGFEDLLTNVLLTGEKFVTKRAQSESEPKQKDDRDDLKFCLSTFT